MKETKVLLTKNPLPVWVSWSRLTLHTTEGAVAFKSREALKAEIKRLNLAQSKRAE